MYHTNKINQAQIQKNLNIPRFSPKDSQSDHYTPTEQKIYKQLLKHPNNTSNAYIAKIVGCSIITVIRATNKFHRDGRITKYQENRYSFNNYSFGMKIDHKNKKVIPYGNDILKKDLILVDSLSRRLCVVSYAGVRGIHTQKQQKTLKKGENKVNATQKQMILAQRDNPKIKEILNTPNIKSQIITPTIQTITQLLHLDENEQFKLVAFSEDVIEHTLSEVSTVIHTGKAPKVFNRMEWVLRFARDYCTQHSIKPDWSWYYTICELLGISTKSIGKPLIVPKTQQHKKNNIQELTNDQQLAKLTRELKAREERYSIYSGSFLDRKTIENLKQEISKLEGNSNEKQSIQHTNNTNTLAEVSEECEPVLRRADERQSFLWPIPKPTAWG
jgi:hypothetical protein